MNLFLLACCSVLTASPPQPVGLSSLKPGTRRSFSSPPLPTTIWTYRKRLPPSKSPVTVLKWIERKWCRA